MSARMFYFKIWIFIKLHYSYPKDQALTNFHTNMFTTDSNASQKPALNVPSVHNSVYVLISNRIAELKASVHFNIDSNVRFTMWKRLLALSYECECTRPRRVFCLQ